jgi:hypothetical protein
MRYRIGRRLIFITIANRDGWLYQHVTPAVFRKLQLMAKQQGFELAYASHGTFTVRLATCKIGFNYTWDAQQGKLVIRCHQKPMLISMQSIHAYADQIICQSGGTRVRT